MLFVTIEEFAIKTGLGALDEHVPFECGVLGIDFYFKFFEFFKGKS